MEVTQPPRAQLGLAVGLNPNTVTLCVQQQDLSVRATINDPQEFMHISLMGISFTEEKQPTGNFLMRLGKVQML